MSKKLLKYLSEITQETPAEEIKETILKLKESKKASITLNGYDWLLFSNRLKMNKLYENYKEDLITKEQKNKVKTELIKNMFIEEKVNKDGKNVGYTVIPEHAEELKKWLDLNLRK